MGRAAPRTRVRDGQPAPDRDALTYLERLGRRVDSVGTSLCVGVDPDQNALPRGFTKDLAGVESFSRLVIEATASHVAAFKANLAFFEAFGSAGIAALERVRAAVPAAIPFIADVKRGDIGSTAARQAVALFDVLGADAITVNPYLGRAAVAPLIERSDRFAYVLCRTSNEGAGELQDMLTSDGPLYLAVARRVAAWASDGATVGLVVGATAPHELASVRSSVPALPFLVPGVGAQGGDVDAVLANGPATAPPAGAVPGGGLLVNVSRGVYAEALGASDPGVALRVAAERWADILRVLR
jgi:orotidine-5'-phosphate decarboxylase